MFKSMVGAEFVAVVPHDVRRVVGARPSVGSPVQDGIAWIRQRWINQFTQFAPALTLLPDRLDRSFADHPEAAAASACSIVHDVRRPRSGAHTPDDATDRMWRRQYLAYRTRQIQSQLRAAACQIETVRASVPAVPPGRSTDRDARVVGWCADEGDGTADS
jgi:hypothetical protein